jgi:hypothetical protein
MTPGIEFSDAQGCPCASEGELAMDNMARVEQYVTSPPDPTEDQFTKTLERYTAQIPSSALLALAIGAMGLSLVGQLGGRGKWGNFIAQWVPTIIAMGVYNKLVKLEGHDQYDRGQRDASGGSGQDRGRRSGISNRSYAEEQAAQESLPPRGQQRAAS